MLGSVIAPTSRPLGETTQLWYKHAQGMHAGSVPWREYGALQVPGHQSKERQAERHIASILLHVDTAVLYAQQCR